MTFCTLHNLKCIYTVESGRFSFTGQKRGEKILSKSFEEEVYPHDWDFTVLEEDNVVYLGTLLKDQTETFRQAQKELYYEL